MTDIRSEGDRCILNRRRLLGLTGAAAVAALLPGGGARAAQQCSDYDWQGVQYCTAGIPSRIAGQSALPQHQSQWCWAACISMIFGYYNRPVHQERVVRETFGRIVDMPANPLQILSAVNRPWTDERGKPFRGYGEPLRVDPTLAARYMAQEKPLIIGTMGHAMVLTALSWAQDRRGQQQLTGLVVRDPWIGGQRRELSGQEIQSAMFLAHVDIRHAAN